MYFGNVITILLSLLLVLTIACSRPPPLELSMKYQKRDEIKSYSECENKIYFQDNRRYKDLGQMGGAIVTTKSNILDWMHKGIEKKLGYKINLKDKGDVLSDRDWVIQLNKLYVNNQTQNMAATTVLMLINKSLDYKKIYRGSVTHSNWSSGKGETLRALNHSLEDGLLKMRNDIKFICDKSS